MSQPSPPALTSQSQSLRCALDALQCKRFSTLTHLQVQRQGMRFNYPLQRFDQRRMWMWFWTQPCILLDKERLHRSRKRYVDGSQQSLSRMVPQGLRHVLPSLFNRWYHHRKDYYCREMYRCLDRKQMRRRLQIARRSAVVQTRNVTMGLCLKPIKVCSN
jgi:hypothetical protein